MRAHASLPRVRTGGGRSESGRARACACHAGSNRAIQARLRVGAQDDPMEREADRAADRVVAGESAGPLGSASVNAQRKCAACTAEERETVRRQPGKQEEDEELQLKSGKGGPNASGAEGAAAAVSQGGKPLPGELKSYFEPRFGQQLSGVRIHDHPQANSASLAINARAFTLGRDIAFGKGQYDPASSGGLRLLAHELAHVVQQKRTSNKVIRREQLHFYDFTDNALRRGGYAAHYCDDYSYIRGACARDKPGMLHAGIDEISDVAPNIRSFRRRGHSIDSIYFHTHGAPGYIHLPSGGIVSGNVWGLNAISSEISANATVGFLGCNVGEGRKGNQFLLNAGSSLLMNGGGTVYASDSVTFSVPGIGQRRPVWSSLKRVCVAPGGSSHIC